MLNKKQVPLILGLSIPVLMILFVAASIYIPGLFFSPQYNFLYSTENNYYGGQAFSVSDSRLIKNPITLPQSQYYRPYPYSQLYIHDIRLNKSMPITFAEATSLTLDPSIRSPDGYEIKDGSNNGGFLFFSSYSRDYQSKYIVGHNTSRKLSLNNNAPSYSNTISFIGWIMR